MITRKRIVKSTVLSILTLAACLLAPQAVMPQKASADPAAIMGCGNFNDAKAGDEWAQQFQALQAAGVKTCRMPIFPFTYYWATKAATPARFDAAALQAHSFGITPVVLFEYYTRFSTPVGDYNVWRDIGKAFATRFKPNSDWWLSQGIKNYGVSLYAAINEPDINLPKMDPKAYHDALKGLADGVHEAGADLKVVPGGLGGPNSHFDYTCAGLTAAIADLLNDGTLDGLDMHTYNGRWVPLAGHQFCAQHDFDAVKKAAGVTRDINFYSTEFNYQEKTGEAAQSDIGDGPAGAFFLTMIWDNLGIVGNAGTNVTKLALCWNLFIPMAPDTQYAMCNTLSPWAPNARGAAYKLVAELTKGMSIVKSEPRHSGTVTLAGNGKTMWVWQDRANWSSFAGQSCTLSGVPKAATELYVYGYDGLRKTIPLTGASGVRVTDLPGTETYMFVANADEGGANVGIRP